MCVWARGMQQMCMGCCNARLSYVCALFIANGSNVLVVLAVLGSLNTL